MRATTFRTANLEGRRLGLTSGWIKRHAVAVVAVLAALASAIAVPPDRGYLDYFDVRTLVCLFCAMAVVSALDNIGFIHYLAGRAIHHFRSRRGLIVGLVYLTFLAAMFVSNDVALLTFLPLTFVALEATGSGRFLALAFILETAAANLGGMITPFGSPQNLFLFSFFEIPTLEFIGIMAIPFAVSMITISALSVFVPNASIDEIRLDSSLYLRPTVIYLGLFAFTIAIIFRLFPLWTGIFVPAILMLMDRSALSRLDWGLLLTFVAFFVFVGNLTRLESVSATLGSGLGDDVLLWSTLGSQVISNVPAAILFAPFTDLYRELLVGVNIGGVGTMVASLANLIALAKYREYQPGRTGSFLLLFSAINFGLLLVLFVVMTAVFSIGLL